MVFCVLSQLLRLFVAVLGTRAFTAINRYLLNFRWVSAHVLQFKKLCFYNTKNCTAQTSRNNS